MVYARGGDKEGQLLENGRQTQLRGLHKTHPPALQKGQAVGGKDSPGAGMVGLGASVGSGVSGHTWWGWGLQWAVGCQGRRGGSGERGLQWAVRPRGPVS